MSSRSASDPSRPQRVAFQMRWPAILVLALLASGCKSLFDSEAADKKWQTDYARCRFGMTLEQLDEHNAQPEPAGLPQNPHWRACLAEAGWQTDPAVTRGPEWED